MSQAGKYTPLQLNLLAELGQGDAVFTINPTLAAIVGAYTPSSYKQGSFTNSNFLQKITAAYPLWYQQAAAGTIALQTYRKLISMGLTVCSALANGRPNTFTPTYPGYGSWVGSTEQSASYPPKNYPNETTYSYIGTGYGQYAYLTGWPGTNAWQKISDTYMAAQPPRSVDTTTTTYDAYFSNGFMAQIAQQAYYEIWSGQFDQAVNVCDAFQQTSGSKGQSNQQTASIVNGQSFMSGSYSNINDLTTNNISGVNQSFHIWGGDLINTGKAIDLSNIDKFGTPSVLLRTLQRCGAYTTAVGLAMQYAGLTNQDMNNILTPTYTPTITQEKQIYSAFGMITGNDLYGVDNGITIQLNCRLNNLNTLADLLDPKMLFPNSYLGLTVPQYVTTPTNSKVYFLIYQNGGVNPQVAQFGQPLTDTLTGILPQDIATACGAFSRSMQQISNIKQCPIEKFALSVQSLELTNQNLPQTNTTTGTPVNTGAVNNYLATLAFGSGSNHTYRQCDYFGSACGYPYIDLLTQAVALINQLPTGPLSLLYTQIYQLGQTLIPLPPDPQPDPPIDPFNPVLDGQILALINQVNSAIAAINQSNSAQVQQLNAIWNQIGQQLTAEQQSIPYAIPQSSDITATQSQLTIQSFVSSIDQYAQDNSDGGDSTVLDGIADNTTLGGQTLIACLREARNAQRLQWGGIGPNNDVSDALDTCRASATAQLNTDGSIAGVTMINGSSGYTVTNPPQITIYPPGYGGVLAPVIQPNGSISGVAVIKPGIGYPYITLEFDVPPQCQPDMSPGNTQAPVGATQPTFPGTDVPGFAANPYVPGPVPPLPPPPTASPTIDETIGLVTTANCDCWDM